jgi:hypothetical protein
LAGLPRAVAGLRPSHRRRPQVSEIAGDQRSAFTARSGDLRRTVDAGRLRDGVSESAIDASAVTDTPGAEFQRRTLVAACAAIVAVKPNVDTRIAAQRRTRGAIVADPLAATRCCVGTDVAARTAVIRIGIQESARPVAVDSARGAVVNTKSRNARDNLVGRRRGTLPAAASTVEDIVIETGAMATATALARGAADIAATRSTDAAGVVIARPTDLETLSLLRLVVTFAEASQGSAFPAQAVPSPSGVSTAPLNTAPSRRSDSRRGTDSASDLENSSNRWSMIGPFR